MDQITASVRRQGPTSVLVDYVTGCGCSWTVDQHGNIHAVKVCRKCMDVRWELTKHFQTELFN